MKAKKERKIRGGVYFRPGGRGSARFNGVRGWWWISFNLDGKQVRESTNALTKAEAVRIRQVKLTDFERGELRLPGKKKAILLHPLAEEYLSYAKANKSSWKSDVCYLRRIREYFGNVPVERITRADCEEFKKTLTEEWKKRAWAKAGTDGERPEIRLTTVDRYVGALKRLFNWAVEQGSMSENPARRVKLHRQDRKPYYLLSDEEEARLLEAAGEGKSPHLKNIVVLALASAMRSGEIRGLRWDQVDLGRRMVTLAGDSTKNSRVKHVPLNVDAMAVLEERLQSRVDNGIYVFPNSKGKQMTSVKTAWRQALKRAGIPERCRFHGLRHTSISRMVMAGVPEVTIGRMAGWTDNSAPFMLRHYAHLTGDHLHQAAKALERGRLKHKLSTSYGKAPSEGVVNKAVSA
jgi:integrase